MVGRHKIIIDTDPGVDDLLALLLALASEELDVLAITLVQGNVDVNQSLANIVTLFNILEQEYQVQGKSRFRHSKPIVSVGAAVPMGKIALEARYFHGRDGLGGATMTYPEIVPSYSSYSTWFHDNQQNSQAQPSDNDISSWFTPSTEPAHNVISKILEDNEPDTVTLVTIGPMTNAGLLARDHPASFSRVKEIVSMGGTVALPGNVTPVAEFNIAADPEAAQMVVDTLRANHSLDKFTFVPLDITLQHSLTREPLLMALSKNEQGALEKLVKEMSLNTLAKMKTIMGREPDGLEMHDAVCIYYILIQDQCQKRFLGVNVECDGKWTRGMTVFDRRGLAELVANEPVEKNSDEGGWLRSRDKAGVLSITPGKSHFIEQYLNRVFGFTQKV